MTAVPAAESETVAPFFPRRTAPVGKSWSQSQQTTQTQTKQAPAAPDYSGLKVPDGSKLDVKRVEEIATWAKERSLDPKVAQDILTREHELVSSVEAARAAEVDGLKDRLLNDLKADKEMGGDKLNSYVEPARRLVDRFGNEAFKSALDQTGLGNHPELVRFLANIAKAVGEDKLVLPSANGGSSEKAPWERLYGAPK